MLPHRESHPIATLAFLISRSFQLTTGTKAIQQLGELIARLVRVLQLRVGPRIGWLVGIGTLSSQRSDISDTPHASRVSADNSGTIASAWLALFAAIQGGGAITLSRTYGAGGVPRRSSDGGECVAVQSKRLAYGIFISREAILDFGVR